ncbi:hypothetical protein CAPTEDRAFT_148361 [Capitella teleta]|uniref:Uncharacterized protein n=1 Tax=Capitella teleta TaxID=283909 RepID=R7VGJ3_CAPTE|nr:hypothetical protein CAPTEDRAFT_148361 [Capitella teleta]|eukprot:ELU14810.1 hypothetical protein CAPTEDRAFT_148361 [Capitella teleta]
MTNELVTRQWSITVYDVPTPPFDLTVDSVGATEVIVTWSLSLDDCNSPVSHYLFTARYDSLDEPSDVDKGETSGHNTTSVTIRNLSPYTNYSISGVAINAAGSSSPSDAVLVATKQAGWLSLHYYLPHLNTPSAPSQKPRFEHYVADSTSLMMQFHAPPADTHNGPLLGYNFSALVESSRDLVHSATIADPHITTHNISGLQPAKKYIIYIFVYNAIGAGPPSQQILSTDEGVPTAPVILGSSSKSWDTLRVVWQSPEKPNGRLRGYNVYWQQLSKGLTGKAVVTKGPEDIMHTHTITGLEPCTMYRVFITAFTSKGEGDHQSPHLVSTEVKGANRPNITRLEKASNNSHSVEVHWLPSPSSTSHVCTIDRYVIYFNASDPNDNRIARVEGRLRKFIVSNLTATNYSVSMAAESQSIHSSIYVRGELSELRVIQLGSWDNNGLGGNSLTAGIIAGVVLWIFSFVPAWFLRYFLYSFYFIYLFFFFISMFNCNLPVTSIFYKISNDPEESEHTAIPVSKWQTHVAKLHADDDFGFSEEYQDVDCGPSDHFLVNASVDQENRSKNRYINILAYDHSRVCLRSLPGKSCSDYINANYVDGYHKPKAYVATQGPLPNTFGDFWRLVWEQNSSIIVMITNLTERGKRKCDQYWPKDEEQQVTYDQMQVKLLNTYKMAHYTVRVFSLRNLKLKKKLGSSERVILQYHYTDWPDHGVPDYTLPTLTFIRKSIAAHNEAQGSGPLIIHCSAGVGRTGTFIVIDSMIRQMQDVKTINVFGFLSHIRNQRNQLVQTEDQYIFIHDALLEYIQSGNTEIKDSSVGRYVEDLLLDKDGSTVIEYQYKLVTQFCPKDYHTAAALLTVNLPKNREDSLLPVDLARVRLPTRPGEEGSDYINASFMQGYNKNEEFIVTQHPLPSTQEDFWRMVWEHNSMTIVLLNPPDPEKETDFPIFWPSRGTDLEYGHFTVTFVEENPDMHLLTRDFLLQSTQDDYECTTRIFATTSWPEGCEPLSQCTVRSRACVPREVLGVRGILG